MWSLLQLTCIKEMICVLYCNSDFIILEQWNSGCLSVNVYINTCIKAVSWHIGLHEPHVILCADQFPKRDFHGVGAGHKVSFVTSQGLPKRLAMILHCPWMCSCIWTYVSRHSLVAWYVSMWLGSLKSNWCGLAFCCWRRLMVFWLWEVFFGLVCLWVVFFFESSC